MKKKIVLPNVNYPVHVWHPSHAPVHPCLCPDAADLERLIRDGWYTNQSDMELGKPNQPEAVEEEEADDEDSDIEDAVDEVDDMLAHEDAANESSTDDAPKKKKKKSKKK